MKKFIYSCLVIALFFTGSVMAQKKAIIKFDRSEYDYGLIKEEAGKAKCRFNFTNNGDDTLKLISVKPGCGCTTVDYTKTPVMPGKSGYIDAIFDPAKRPGMFTKSITVLTNDPAQKTVLLSLKGNVMAQPETSAEVFPVVAGNLRMKSGQFNLGNIKNDEIRIDTLKIINNWKKTMNLGFKGLAPYVTAIAVPAELKPGKQGLLIITYDASKRNDFGYVYDRVTLTTNDSISPDKGINISMNLMEDFSKLTPEQLANAAKIKFEKVNYKFDKVKQGEKVDCEFVYTNIGKSDLSIRKIKASCGCTTTNAEKTLLKPGESSKISATFNTTGKSGPQSKTITVITNDPIDTTVMLTIEGTIEK